MSLKEINVDLEKFQKKKPKKPIFVPVKINGRKRCQNCHIRKEKDCINNCEQCSSLEKCQWTEKHKKEAELVEKQYREDILMYEKEKKFYISRKNYVKNLEIARQTTIREYILKKNAEEIELIQKEHNPPPYQMTYEVQQQM